MTRPWPTPADTPVDRARSICRSYRAALKQAHPDLCARLDAIAEEFGEADWLVDRLDNGEDLINRQDAARRAGVKPDTISQWAARGLITRYPGGYRWSEVQKMLAERRQRRSMKHWEQLQ
jgi:hypothetical protein